MTCWSTFSRVAFCPKRFCPGSISSFIHVSVSLSTQMIPISRPSIVSPTDSSNLPILSRKICRFFTNDADSPVRPAAPGSAGFQPAKGARSASASCRARVGRAVPASRWGPHLQGRARRARQARLAGNTTTARPACHACPACHASPAGPCKITARSEIGPYPTGPAPPCLTRTGFPFRRRCRPCRPRCA